MLWLLSSILKVYITKYKNWLMHMVMVQAFIADLASFEFQPFSFSLGCGSSTPGSDHVGRS